MLPWLRCLSTQSFLLKTLVISKIKWIAGLKLLRRAWDANAAAMGSALSFTCLARNADAWVNRLLDHISRGAKTKQIIDSLEVISKAVAYLVVVVVETVRTTSAR